MNIHTMAEGLDQARNFETESSIYYSDLAKKYPKHAEIFQGFVNDNKKYITQVESAYYNVISDALEGCFALDMDVSKYSINTVISEQPAFQKDVAQAIQVEEHITKYYLDAAEQSDSLMADVPQAFKFIVKKRMERIIKMRELLNN